MKAIEFPTLMTDRLLLRQFVDSDLHKVFEGLSDPEVIEYYGVSYKTLESAKEQMKFFSKLETDGSGIWWAICSLDNKAFYGGVGFNNLSKEHRKAEIGCWLLKDFWRRGVMTEVMPIVCGYGFEILRLHRIEGFVETGNISCKNAMKKLDFNYEGTMRDCEIKNGKFISIDIYAKLSTTDLA